MPNGKKRTLAQRKARHQKLYGNTKVPKRRKRNQK